MPPAKRPKHLSYSTTSASTSTTSTTTSTSTNAPEPQTISDAEQQDDTHIPSDYNFPFKPYTIQLELMKAAFDTFQEQKFALLESPTGTGKSLSLICSSLTWLKHRQSQIKINLQHLIQILESKIKNLKDEEQASSDWISVQAKLRDSNQSLEKLNQDYNKILALEQKDKARWLANLHDDANKLETKTSANKERAKRGSDKRKFDDMSEDRDEILGNQDIPLNEEEFLIDLDENIQPDSQKPDIDKQEEDYVRPKIYYASRTHSQLSQFVSELKKTKFASDDENPPVKVVQLASRSNYCINQDVIKLKDNSAINDRCTELQKEKSASKRCPYFKADKIEKLKESILAKVYDIEDVVSLGKKTGACPYYSSRKALTESEMVVLPYNNLLHQETRKATSLDLKDSIVIIDEAHNILETICSIHSSTLNGEQLLLSHCLFVRYFKKYHKRLKPSNAEQIKNLVKFLATLIKYMQDPKSNVESDSSCANLNVSIVDTDEKESIGLLVGKKSKEVFTLDVNKFISAAKIDDFNIFKMIDFIERSNLPKKLKGFFAHLNHLQSLQEAVASGQSRPTKKAKNTPSTSKRTPKAGTSKEATDAFSGLPKNTPYPIYALLEFIKALTNLNHDGRVLTYSDELESSLLKFLLLNPSSQFEQMVTEARSVVLAGGTMRPFDEFIDILFGPLRVDEDRINIFSCGHIVSKENVLVATLPNGPNAKILELNYKTKSDTIIIDEYGRTIANLSMVVPGGMVCFFPSYDWEAICYNRWNSIGIISTIESRCKKVYREPKKASEVQVVLDDYTQVINRGKVTRRGALLFCVVGGKMSEGINFNDDLGRCVVMVGLPYANMRSAELKQKISYYTKVRTRNTGMADPGQQYYKNLCIKGINQSIGRAIRHQNDYAAILLLDRRYISDTTIRDGLPSWISSSLVDCNKFGQMFARLKQFYKKFNVEEEC